MPEHVLSLSYGKDSLACLGAIEQLGWPLDRIAEDLQSAGDAIALLVAENTYLRTFIKSECPGAELFWADHKGEPGPPGIAD